MRYPRIIAHRCGGALAPENSLAGLAIAARLGCRGVEFDVMLTADGIPILMHDETLERTTSGRGQVAELTLAEIHRFDAGATHHPAFAVSPAPTFEAALSECERLGLWANVEIKPAHGHDALTGRVVAALLAGSPMAQRAVLSSFSETALRAAITAAPALSRALLVDTLPSDWRLRAAELRASAIHLAASGLGPEQADQLLNIPWACYTVNRRSEAEQLRALGCHAIFTDRPDLWLSTEM